MRASGVVLETPYPSDGSARSAKVQKLSPPYAPRREPLTPGGQASR